MKVEQSFQIGAHRITLEAGEVARQADGAVVVRCGQSVVLVTVVAAPEATSGRDFFPLTVEYREKFAAVGRIPGGFLRREGRITENEILVSRLIDRTVRPLFPEGFHREVQLQATVLSATPALVEPPMLALLGAGAALRLSGLPWRGPAGGVRLCRAEGGDVVALPTPEQRRAATLDLVVGAGRDGLVMAEGGAAQSESGPLLELLLQAQEHLAPFFTAVEALASAAGISSETAWAPPERDTLLVGAVEAGAADELKAALSLADKGQRRQRLAALEDEVVADLLGRFPSSEALVREELHAMARAHVRRLVLDEGRRLDGRSLDEVRAVSCNVGWLPATHGSSLFTRGETQAIVTCTMGNQRSEQMIETLEGPENRRFLLHYNFPGYGVGEVRPNRGPGRREIGHGALARRALLPVIPEAESFPYVLRIESEISESNGSSSMATVCGASLAMMDAGVPLDGAVAGIAMGLIAPEGAEPVILTDITGDEDHLGDMDFKVAGTSKGFTAFQLDNKLGELQPAVLERALAAARAGLDHLLDAMGKALSEPREEVPPHAPKAATMTVAPDAVGRLIGPRGATLKEIEANTGVEVRVGEGGTVTLYSNDAEATERARARIEDVVGVVEVGKLYRARVTGVKEYGAFVRVYASAEGLVHVSEWDEGRVEDMTTVAHEGDEVIIRVLGVDARGRIQLSRRAALKRAEDEVVVNA